MAKTIAELQVKATGDVGDAEGKLDSLNSHVDNSAANTRKASMAFIGAGAAIAAGLGLSIGAAATFQQSIQNIGAVAGLTGPQLERVRQLALKLGFSATVSLRAL